MVGWVGDKLGVHTEGQPEHRLFLYAPDKIEKEIAWDAKALASDAAAREKNAEVKKAEDEEEAARVSLDGFEKTLSPMARGRAVKALSVTVKHQGMPISKRDLIRKFVVDGARVTEQGRLEKPDGSFLDSRDLTKIGIDYAKYLGGR